MSENAQNKRVEETMNFIRYMIAFGLYAIVLGNEMLKQAEENYKPTLWDRIRYFPLRIYYTIEDAVEALKDRVLEWLRAKICECYY
ncbi:MAG: hypothetical protein JHC26_09780 [Thermofilum sp.]|jgi:hypothetical protein|uniref:hypothetical protein n=1 Tax=Thermofilum sp. TaxID=1961369 RepID=UPI00258386C4|nr:hypothetical protein [Thermofilum sp.]MCI4409371.1 hypothetical protein [Thermofilum sp.]